MHKYIHARLDIPRPLITHLWTTWGKSRWSGAIRQPVSPLCNSLTTTLPSPLPQPQSHPDYKSEMIVLVAVGKRRKVKIYTARLYAPLMLV